MIGYVSARIGGMEAFGKFFTLFLGTVAQRTIIETGEFFGWLAVIVFISSINLFLMLIY